MRELTFVRPGVVEWRDVAPPTLATPDDALVRPVAVALCDLDVALLHGRTPFHGPFALGHEFVAEIAELGAHVTDFAPGQLVVVAFQIGCGACERCRGGLTGSCRAVPGGAMYGFRPIGGQWGGALADLVRVPFARSMMVAVPAGLRPASIASLSDNVADGWRTVAPHLRESPGAEVLVVGSPSSIPLYAVAAALACGASRVDYLDSDPRALALAKSLGAHVIEGPLPKRAGSYSIVVDASQDPLGLACALRSVAPEGVCSSASIYWEPVALPLLEMYTRGVRFFTGRVNSRAAIPEVLDLVQHGRLQPERITSEIIEWDDAPSALASPSIKPVIVREPL